MLNLDWQKCQGGIWCPLTALKLDTIIQDAGVYLIWYDGNPGKAVRVGQGVFVDRFTEHRNEPAILAYQKRGTLRVTWASVDAHHRDGIERFLAGEWNPLVGSRFPDVAPISVNSPFG